jgi:hypothetical protein
LQLRPGDLFSEKRGAEQMAENGEEKKCKEIKIAVTAVQITHPKGL